MTDQVTPEETSETMYKNSLANCAVLMRNITKNDSADLDPPCRALRCGESGTVTFLNMRDESVAITVIAGETILGNVKRLMETGTEGTEFMAYYG